MSTPEIITVVLYPQALEQVWAALTTPKALARWLLPNDFVPRLGQRFTLRARTADEWPQEIHCEVVTLAAPHRLAFTWQDGDLQRPTLVSFTLEAVSGGTRLRLEHSGFTEASRASARRRLPRQWARLPMLLQVQVDTLALTDELVAFVREQRAPTRNALPLLAELQQAPAPGFPPEILETMVLDGVDQRAFMAEYVATVLDQPGVHVAESAQR